MQQWQLDYFAHKLKEIKQSLLEEIGREGMGKHTSLRESIQELSLIDNHPADVGSELFERSKDLSLHEKRLKNLQEVNDALSRIKEGSYGLCARCGQEIEMERLEALPQALYCFTCKSLLEDLAGEDSKFQRPVEEENLYPPFRQKLTGESDSGISGDDTWQQVARYGTASSPQDTPEEEGLAETEREK